MGNRISKKSTSSRQQPTTNDVVPKKSHSESESPKTNTTPDKKTNPSSNPSSASNKSKKSQESADSGGNRKKIQEMFDKYAEGKDVMGPEAVMKFCDDLQVDPEHISVLILSWHFKAETMCYFKKEEFLTGCESLKCDSISKIMAALSQFPEELKDAQKFKEIYEFAFLWSRESTDKKVLDIETALDMLELLLDEEVYPFIGPFRTFLQEQKSYKGVNKDQWVSLLEFCKTVDEDFSNYDENGSWPVMLDEFVVWAREQNPEKYSSVVDKCDLQNENNFY
eukprot:CAMPEP_0117042870 /NCGR_PEP_ID=MMETSP0472-20121206/29825_1 /TAXON_ID=693140 ORGANISM="Tiarina fusus, Strain LIS" /NCGR_SAMPLE_ID=MMETSP0472 /ASSEMBLY_ACC=CAM_ASM_000603 /LENGTH=279 /DNA_ID=CAMNT_0004754221 /DNA_START=22 /DNA_END=861 /DNA_ORIENTATION=-